MSIISAVIGAVAANPLNITSVSAYPTSGDEGDTINITPIAQNFSNQTVYWTVLYGPDVSSSNFTASTGTYVVSGSSSNFYVSTIADNITQGHAWTFGIKLGTTVGGSDLWTGTNTMVTISDTSRNTQTAALVLDLDPISLVGTGFGSQWLDTSGQSNDGELWNYTYSSDNDYVIILNSTSTYATVPTLTTSTFGSVSVSAWIKPDVVTGLTQAIIAKELCYKLEITTNGSIAWMVKNSADGNWTTTIYADPGLVTTSTWSHVAATVNSSTTQIYINGVLAQTGSGVILGYNNNKLVIGAYDAGQSGFSDYYGGRMGRVEMWNYAITATSVLSYYNSTVGRYNPATYTLTPATTSTNEGSSLTFNVTGTYIVNDTYYWTIETNAGDFATSSGSFAITSNTGTFAVTPTNDFTAEGAETFTVAIRSNSTTGTILSTSTSVTINDTSAPPFSLQFVQGQVDYMDVAPSSDWALGTTWTIEWWSKAVVLTDGGNLLTVMCQNYNNGLGIQMFYQVGLQIQGTTTIAAEPTPNVWTHVALVSDGTNLNLYYNGTSVYTGGAWNLSNNTDAIRIGARGPATFQGFDGKLAMIRISNTAKYSATFTPTTTYGVEADTKLLLGSDNPLVDISNYELNGLNASADGGVNLYFAKSAYPNLDKQIQVGNILSSFNTSTTATVTGAVFLADPANWGVPVTNVPNPGPFNFSGPRPITNNGVTRSKDFPV